MQQQDQKRVSHDFVYLFASLIYTNTAFLKQVDERHMNILKGEE